jgi:hypothetical protein
MDTVQSPSNSECSLTEAFRDLPACANRTVSYFSPNIVTFRYSIVNDSSVFISFLEICIVLILNHLGFQDVHGKYIHLANLAFMVSDSKGGT